MKKAESCKNFALKWHDLCILLLLRNSPLSIWRLKSAFSPYSLKHLSHLNSFIPSWTTWWCFLRVWFVVNFIPHSEHMWFLTPSWTNAICRLRIIFSEKSFPHRLQWKSFFPWRLWYLKWRFRLLSNVNDFPHRWQISNKQKKKIINLEIFDPVLAVVLL